MNVTAAEPTLDDFTGLRSQGLSTSGLASILNEVRSQRGI